MACFRPLVVVVKLLLLVIPFLSILISNHNTASLRATWPAMRPADAGGLVGGNSTTEGHEILVYLDHRRQETWLGPMTYFCPGIVVVELPSSGFFNFLVLLEPSGAAVFLLACYGSNLEAPVQPRPSLAPLR